MNFDVAIDQLGDGYRTRVISSPAGESAVDFTLPFSDKDLEILVLKVAGSIGRFRRKVRRIESDERRLLETFGEQLFKAAFSGRIRECLGRSLFAAETSGAGLRVRLRLPPALVNIPWGVHSRGTGNWGQLMAGSGGSQGLLSSASRMASSAVMP